MSTPALADLSDYFDFTRARTASFRNAAGAQQVAAIDEPRFDHDVKGNRLGLLIEGRPETRLADRVLSKPGAWATGKATILHEFMTPGGKLKRRACYVVDNHRTTVDGLLSAKGWHRQIAVIAGHLKNADGYVRWQRVNWKLSAVVAIDGQTILGVTPEIPLLEG